jgi:hypothetical protein
MIDAGSTGTRVDVYNSTGGLEKLVRMNKLTNTKTKSLHTFDHEKPQQAADALLDILQGVAKFIPAEVRKETKVWLRATAGIRLLEIPKAVDLLHITTEALKNSPRNPFTFVDAKIASGTLEAAYESIAINHMLYNDLNPKNYEGILGLGGASLQIAFKPFYPIRNSEFSYVLPSGEKFSIYAKSFMRFGQGEALKRSYGALVSQNPGKTTITNPCFLKGYQEKITVSGKLITFIGSSDSSACSELAKGLLHEEYECMMPPCSFMGVYTPDIKGTRWSAYSAFFYLVSGLKLLGWNDAKAIQPAVIEKATMDFCGKTAEEAEKWNEHTPWKFLKYYCFNGWFVRHTLRSFGFKPEDESITYRRIIHGEKITWTQGAILYHTQLADQCTSELEDMQSDEE